MYTDEEVRAAMQKVVDLKGPDHTAPSSYFGINSVGRFEAACFLGVLSEIMGHGVPRSNGIRPQEVLGVGGVSPRMMSIFTLAQNLNDARWEWKYILIAVDELLAAEDSTFDADGCGCGCQFSVWSDNPAVRRAMSKITVLRKQDIAEKRALNLGEFAKGGVISTPKSLVLNPWGLPMVTIGAIAPYMGSPHASTPSTAVGGAKKDHALVA